MFFLQCLVTISSFTLCHAFILGLSLLPLTRPLLKMANNNKPNCFINHTVFVNLASGVQSHKDNSDYLSLYVPDAAREESSAVLKRVELRPPLLTISISTIL